MPAVTRQLASYTIMMQWTCDTYSLCSHYQFISWVFRPWLLWVPQLTWLVRTDRLSAVIATGTSELNWKCDCYVVPPPLTIQSTRHGFKMLYSVATDTKPSDSAHIIWSVFNSEYFLTQSLVLINCNALVNFMPHPPPRGGQGNAGDLTNWVVKCPTPGAKSAVKSPLCPQALKKGIWQCIRAKYCAHAVVASNSSECLKATATKIGKISTSMWTAPGVHGDKCSCQIPTWGVGTPWNWQVHNN